MIEKYRHVTIHDVLCESDIISPDYHDDSLLTTLQHDNIQQPKPVLN